MPPPRPARIKNPPPTTELFDHAEDGTPLYWQVYAPKTTGPWPAALITHGGGFKSESKAPKLLADCANDMVAAGYIAFANHYRLAPPGRIQGQIDTGRYPQQHHDIALAVAAARADDRTTGKVVGIGGSAGATHIAYACTVGTIDEDRLDGGVALSGAYKYDERTPDPYLKEFVGDINGYCGTTVLATQLTYSPVDLLSVDMSPCYFVYGNQDTMPMAQTPDMQSAILGAGIPGCAFVEVAGRHAFSLWPTVKTAAIAFLNAAIA